MAPDPMQTVLALLSSNWTPSNTDSKTPKFLKITDRKRYDFDENDDVIFAQRPITEIAPAGIGPANKHEFENFNLDIRVWGSDQEAHFLNVIEEVKKILESKKVNPSADYLILEYDGSGQDMSDKMHKVWRKIMPVQIRRYNISR